MNSFRSFAGKSFRATINSGISTATPIGSKLTSGLYGRLGYSETEKAWSLYGLVSRVTPVHTAVRNCTRDEGRPFEVGNQVLISSHRKLLSSRAMVVNVAEKSERDFGGMIERGERKRTADDVSKAD